MSEQAIRSIEAEFLTSDGWRKSSPLDRDLVRGWMKSPDLEVLGITHRLLFDKEHLSRVAPALPMEEITEFRKRYYERCLREYSVEDDLVWADWGFNSSHNVVYWFTALYQDKATSSKLLSELKDWIALLLKARVQDGLLATAVCDHLLMHKKTARFFRDWNDDPELCACLPCWA